MDRIHSTGNSHWHVDLSKMTMSNLGACCALLPILAGLDSIGLGHWGCTAIFGVSDDLLTELAASLSAGYLFSIGYLIQ